MNYYQHNIGDFAILTQGLDLESVGIVIRVIDRMMSTEKPIKTQWVSLAFPKETQEKAICILESLFEETEEGWVHPILIEQIDQYQRNVQKNRENGKKGGRPRKSETQPKPTGFSEETQTEAKETLTNNHKPITNNHKEEKKETKKKSAPKIPTAEKPEGVSEELWAEWFAHKKRKSGSVTQRMVDGLIREADKAGITVAQAMEFQLEKGWTGFEADWYKKSVGEVKPGKASRPTDPQHGIGVCQPPAEPVKPFTLEEALAAKQEMIDEGLIF